MNVPVKHRSVAHAWVDGAEVEFKSPHEYEWEIHTRQPSWYEEFDYRIKPKPKVKKWKWAMPSTFHFTVEQAYAMGFTQKIDGSMIEEDDE